MEPLSHPTMQTKVIILPTSTQDIQQALGKASQALTSSQRFSEVTEHKHQGNSFTLLLNFALKFSSLSTTETELPTQNRNRRVKSKTHGTNFQPLRLHYVKNIGLYMCLRTNVITFPTYMSINFI